MTTSIKKKKFIVSIETEIEINSIEDDFEAKCAAERLIQRDLDDWSQFTSRYQYKVVDAEQEDEDD